nr:triose-phosphate isomerase [Escherichia coli]
MAKREAEGSHIMLGAQNGDLNLSGAFTGETSAAMLKASAHSTSSSVTLNVVLTTKN